MNSIQRCPALLLAALCLLASAARLTAAAAPASSAAPVAAAGANKSAAAPVIKPHVLAITELINVSVENEPDLLRTVTIDDKGMVNLSLVGQVKVADLNVDQAARAIERAYVEGQFLRRPKVSITVERQVMRTVNVIGQVKKPGNLIIPSDRDIDIVDVILLADGFTEVAKESDVRVTRVLPDGSTKTWEKLDVGGMLKGRKDRKDALLIQAGDIINVEIRMF